MPLAGATLGANSIAHAGDQEKYDAPLAPSIAALKSMKDQATPITKEEREARQENARRLMATNISTPSC